MDSSTISIRPIVASDRERWRFLWTLYCEFHEVELPDKVTETIWERIADPESSTHALAATSPDGDVVAIMNYVLHPHTWSDKEHCFVVDLYVGSEWRRKGIADSLMAWLAEKGRREGWFRIYWNTEPNNRSARSWHDKIAKPSPHLTYHLDL